MPSRVVCPSGLQIDIRGFKAKEAGLLADRVGMRSGASYTSILAACSLSVADCGPYKLAPGGGVHWGQAIVADRFYALLRIRAATYGEDYWFNVQCDNEACREPIEWELRLCDLPFKALPESSRELLRQGKNRFESTIPSLGKKVWFKLQTGDGEASAAKVLKGSPTDMMTQALAARIIEVEGVPAHQRVDFLGELEMADVMRLLERFDDADGGVETRIEIECRECGNLMEVELPLGKDFFMPHARKKKSKAATNTSGQGNTTESSPTSSETGSANASSPSATSSTAEAG
jgi:hypothetical protein